MQNVIAPVLGLAIALGALTAPTPRADVRQVPPPRQDYASGGYLYNTFCASCHGATGAGDGAVAAVLRQRPPDLSTITQRSGGTFPRDRVYTIIDGRKPVAGHGSGEMPVWGDALRVTEGQDEAIVRRRITALVQQIEIMQKKGR
jgi:mono/diheme cytochrome c family protein